MAIALVSSVVWSPGSGGGESAGIDTTGATLLAIHGSSFSSITGVSDSKGNTWVPLTEQNQAGSRFSRLWYAENPTVGAGHTFTVAGSLIFSYMVAASFSGVATSSPFDVENGDDVAGVSAIQPGSVTPSEDDELFVTGMCSASGNGTPAIDSSFSVIASQIFVGGTSMAGGMAYKVQTSAGAENPTWSWVDANNAAAIIAVFLSAGAPPAGGLPPIAAFCGSNNYIMGGIGT